MLTFVVVCARPGRAVAPWVLDVLREQAPAELTFRPDDRLHWSDDTGLVHVAAWQTGAEHLGVGSRWHVGPGGLTAFSGHPWYDTTPWAPGRSWAQQLGERIAVHGIDEVRPRLDGVFNLVTIDHTGRGHVFGDPFGVGLTYQGRSDELHVFSNRASLVARLITPPGRAPARDVEGAVNLAYANNIQTDRTTFAGVTTLPLDAVVRLGPGADPVVEVGSALPWMPQDPTAPDEVAELVAGTVDHLRALVRLMAALPCPVPTLELTGGRDSRMILALLLAEGVADRFVYVTWGGPDLPDVQVAGVLADRFDLDLRAEGRPRRARRRPGLVAPTRPTGAGDTASSHPSGPSGEPAPEPAPPPDHRTVLARHVWRTSGAVSIWDQGRQRRTVAPAIFLTGQFGELLRTNYPRTSGVASMADLAAYVREGELGFDAANLLRRSARRHLDDQVIGQLRTLQPVGGTAQDAVDGFNIATRLRRWFGSGHELDNRNRLFPLYSLPATQTAFSIGSHRRRLEALPLDVLLATVPELATMGFAPSGWPESLVADRADRASFPTTPDCPPWRPRGGSRFGRLRAQAAGRQAAKLSVEQRTMRDIEAKIPVLRELLDLGPRHELYRYLDYDVTMQAVSDLARHDFLARRSIHDAVTAAMWLGGAEQPEPL
jgi:hypothetical protein